MTQINFLPPSYLGERRKQLRVMRESMLIVILAGLIIAWYLGTQARVRSLENLVAARQQEVDSVASQMTELGKIEQEREALMHQLQLERDLAQPINHSAVVATLAKLMPPTMALTDMSIQMPIPKPPAAKKEESKNSKSSKAAPAEAKAAPLMEVSVVGLAASDLEVADFLGGLTSNPLFSGVKLAYSRSVELKDKEVRGREFRVEMQIRLDRLYVAPQTADASGKGAADVH